MTPTMMDDDLVHWDFIPGNILVDHDGRVTGVVDWSGIGRGARAFSLTKLRFRLERLIRHPCSTEPTVDPGAITELDNVLDTHIPPDVARMCWAHWSLSLIDWSLRSGAAEDAEIYLELAETRIDSPTRPTR